MNNLILNFSKSVIIIVIASLVMSCNQNEVLGGLVEINSIEELDAIMTSCSENEFLTREEIEDNLIGNWDLLGIRSGWVNEFEKGNISLEIDEDKIVLNDNDTEEFLETAWKLRFIEVNTYQYFYLETSEEGFNNRLGMETFCGQYMYGTGLVDDGNTYVYQKVE